MPHAEEPDDVLSQRAHPRVRCAGAAEVHLYPAGATFSGKVVDLSLGGCCIEVEEPIGEPPGAHVEVYLRVTGTTVQVVGILRSVRNEVWAGIQFWGVSPRKIEQIQELIGELFAAVKPSG
jgi:c-di-GMP-binding flagellar brake protein YcgR